jgi:hypothetical protein
MEDREMKECELRERKLLYFCDDFTIGVDGYVYSKVPIHNIPYTLAFEIKTLKEENKLAKQLITKTLQDFGLTNYDWKADQNEITTELKTFILEKEQLKEENEGLKIKLQKSLAWNMSCEKRIAIAEDFIKSLNILKMSNYDHEYILNEFVDSASTTLQRIREV